MSWNVFDVTFRQCKIRRVRNRIQSARAQELCVGLRLRSRAALDEAPTMLGLCAFLALLNLPLCVFAASPDSLAQDSQQDQIRRVVEQLGSSDFVIRQYAQEKITEWGPAAFDGLREAQDHPDLEVAVQAKFLLNQLHVIHAHPDDPPEAKTLLQDYSRQSEGQRALRISRLAHIVDPGMTTVLCRIAQLEASEPLSRQAAVHVLRRQVAVSHAAREAVADEIMHYAASSRRASMEWLQAFAVTIRDPRQGETLWRDLIAEQRAEQGEENRKPSVELRKWYADFLLQVGRRRDAERQIGMLVPNLDRDRENLIETLDWLIDRHAWSATHKLVERFDLPVEDASVGYRLAEADRVRGDAKRAGAQAQIALDRPSNDTQERMNVGEYLVERGLYDWAASEFLRMRELDPESPVMQVFYCNAMAGLFRAQGALDQAYQQFDQALKSEANPLPASSEELGAEALRLLSATVYARRQYAEMLHDEGRDQDAAQVLRPLVDQLRAKNKVFEQLVGDATVSIPARMHFFLAEHHRQNANHPAQIKALNRGAEFDDEDIDILIAMYRVSNPPDEWSLINRIRSATRGRRAEIRRMEVLLERQAALTTDLKDEQRRLALELNVYAWLVSNTTGDYRDALRCSKRSLELVPDESGYLDTLARCYFALGDIPQAIHYQEQAVARDAHSGQMNRQLAFFLRRREQVGVDNQPES